MVGALCFSAGRYSRAISVARLSSKLWLDERFGFFFLFCLICFPSESTVQALGKRWSYSELCTNLPLKALQAKVLRSPSLLTKLQEVVHWVLEIILCLRPAEWPAWWVAARLWLLSVAFGSTLHGVTCTALEARVRLGSETAQGAGWAVRGAVPCGSSNINYLLLFLGCLPVSQWQSVREVLPKQLPSHYLWFVMTKGA